LSAGQQKFADQRLTFYHCATQPTKALPLHQNKTLYHQRTQIITDVDVKLNKWHITIKKLYRKQSETKQNLKKYDPAVGLNREPKTQQAIAFPLRQQATRWKWSKAPI